MKLLCFLFALVFSLFHSHTSPTKRVPHLITITGVAQGTTYTVKYISTDSIVTSSQITTLLQSIDSSLSLYKPYSLISRFNQSRDCIQMDVHLKLVINQALQIASASKGAFDPTCKPLSELWGFGTHANHSKKSPSPYAIRKKLELVGYPKITMNNNSLCKSNPRIKIDCDGIAQGYSVDFIADFMNSKGVQNYIVELGGEIYAKGYNIHDLPWSVGIEEPSLAYGENWLIKRKVILNNAAITTSGNYRKFKQLGNTYFSHIIDPIHGTPVNNGIISVSVLADNATCADGWDNAFMVMGLNHSIHVADSLKNIGVYIRYQDKSGLIKDTCNTYFLKHLDNSLL